MDTSETYIKMCDCPEIQKDYDFTHGDFVYIDKDYGVMNLGAEWKFGTMDDGSVWLPRQDQIQEMLIKERFGDFGAHWDMCIDIPIQFVAKNPKLELSSMEQIWLSCYMLAIHQKTWDGEKWIKK